MYLDLQELVNAKIWRCICTSFHASNDLCDPIALFARHLCTTNLSPSILASFLSLLWINALEFGQLMSMR